MKHLDLFSGIGGFALAAQWAGIETVGFCEINEWCDENALKVNWPGMPNFKDVRKLCRRIHRKLYYLLGTQSGGGKINHQYRLWLMGYPIQHFGKKPL